MKKRLAAATLTLLLCSFPAAAEQTSRSRHFKLSQQSLAPFAALPSVAATVDGIPILLQDFWRRMMRRGGSDALDDMINEVLIQEAVKAKIYREWGKRSPEKGQELEKEISRRLEEAVRTLQLDQSLKGSTAPPSQEHEDLARFVRFQFYKEFLLAEQIRVTPEEVKLYFKENRSSLIGGEIFHLREIYVGTEQELRDMELALKAGADFAALAREKTLNTFVRDRGGDIGFHFAAKLPREVLEKILPLKPGEWTSVSVPGGYRILRMEERKPGTKGKNHLDREMEEKITDILREAKLSRAYPALIDALQSRANIRIFLEP